MAHLNEVRLIGNLTRDPESMTTHNGHTLSKFGFATNRRYKSKDGTLQEETTFLDIECWGKTADICNQYLKKGSCVYIGGRLKFDSWQDKETGQKRSKVCVVAENVQFLDRKGSNGSNGQQSSGDWDYSAPGQNSKDMDKPPF